MKDLSRRQFLATASMAVAASQISAQTTAGIQVSLTLPAEAKGAHMPADFLGLSYEIEQLTDPSFFSAKNTGLVHAFKELSANGVLRLGGNTGEFAWWKPTPETPEPEHPKTREVEGEPKAQYYSVTAEAVRNLAAFLEATGWTCIYGLNMGTNTPERAADEAAFAAKTLGARLQYFQIGNEADLYGRHLRDAATWTAKAYLDEWLAIARAIVARVPDARFGMPDVASDISWLGKVADEWASVPNPPRVVVLSHHHYFGGPATNPEVNIPNLLKLATMDKVQHTCDTANAAGAKMHVRVRMTEGNTCYRGGKPGVSDVFAATLWAANYTLVLASNNYTGINLHGGTGMSVANGLGGFLPGDVMLKEQGVTPEQIATHPHPFYTPIATFGSDYRLQPVADGLRLACSLSGGTFFQGDFSAQIQAAGVNGAAFAAKHPDGRVSVILLNKDPDHDLSVRLTLAGRKTGRVTSENFHAAALDSRDVRSAADSPAKLEDGTIAVHVPRASALRLTVS